MLRRVQKKSLVSKLPWFAESALYGPDEGVAHCKDAGKWKMSHLPVTTFSREFPDTSSNSYSASDISMSFFRAG